MTELEKKLKPGDVVNFKRPKIDISDLFGSIEVIIGSLAIGKTQREVFCQLLDQKKIEWEDHHTEMYFNSTRVFSVELPKPLWLTISNLNNCKDVITIYRMNPEYFGRELKESDIEIMREAGAEIISWNLKYDFGQLLDMLINTVAGYPYLNTINVFDAGKRNMVCSVGVASIIAKWRHELKRRTGEEIPQPWKTLNPSAWTAGMILKYPGHWDIDATMPANFATTDTNFNNEFIRVGQFIKGKQIS